MKTWIKTIGIMLSTLALWITQTSIALARAGGGHGGSIGGSAGRSFSGGSYSGGSSLGGFHFFPFFFGGWGWGGGGSFGGIITIIVIIAILYVVYKAYKAKNARRGSRNKGFGGPNVEDISPDTPVDSNGEVIDNTGNDQRFAKAITFTRENMRYFAETFPRWDRDYLAGRVRQVFFWFQDAWSRMDLSEGSEYVTAEMLSHYRTDLDEMKSRGERNMIKDPILNAADIQFIHSSLSEDDERFVVMIWANLVDYTVDSQGRIVAGDDTNRLYFTEFWEFRWENENWLLAKIYQEDALEIAKIARGDGQ